MLPESNIYKQADADLNPRTRIIWQGRVNITLMTFFYLATLCFCYKKGKMPLFRDEQSLLICGLEQSEASSPFSTWSPRWHNLVVIHYNHRENDSLCPTHTKRALLFDTILTGPVPYLYLVPHNLLQEFLTR